MVQQISGWQDDKLNTLYVDTVIKISRPVYGRGWIWRERINGLYDITIYHSRAARKNIIKQRRKHHEIYS